MPEIMTPSIKKPSIVTTCTPAERTCQLHDMLRVGLCIYNEMYMNAINVKSIFVEIFRLVATVVLVFEAPICCSFIELTKPIAVFAEKRTFFQKAIIYVM